MWKFISNITACINYTFSCWVKRDKITEKQTDRQSQRHTMHGDRYGRRTVHDMSQPTTQSTFTHSFSHSFIHSFIRSVIHDSFIQSVIHSVSHSFSQLFTDSFTQHDDTVEDEFHTRLTVSSGTYTLFVQTGQTDRQTRQDKTKQDKRRHSAQSTKHWRGVYVSNAVDNRLITEQRNIIVTVATDTLTSSSSSSSAAAAAAAAATVCSISERKSLISAGFLTILNARLRLAESTVIKYLSKSNVRKNWL